MVGHCYTHSETKRETKKYESIDVRIHADLPIIYPNTETDREKEREKRGSRDVLVNTDQETYTYTYNQWQYSPTLIQIFRQKERHKCNAKNVYGHTVSHNIARHCYRHSEITRETEIRIKRRAYTNFDSAITPWLSWTQLFIYMKLPII